MSILGSPVGASGRLILLYDTFDDDQESSLADYIEFSLQRQYNMRGRSRDDM